MIFLNYKTYEQSSGDNAVDLAKIVNEVSKNSGVEIVSCPTVLDIIKVLDVATHPVWAQHVDWQKRGQATGWIPPELVEEAGADGVLINHSEHKLSFNDLDEVIERSKSVGLKTLVFADSPKEADITAKKNPDWIGYEPPEFVGSANTSVARSKPEVIEIVSKTIKNISIAVGAGIKDKMDVVESVARGATAVVVSSAVVLADDPKKVLEELVSGFTSN